jgi:hypothetical protein
MFFVSGTPINSYGATNRLTAGARVNEGCEIKKAMVSAGHRPPLLADVWVANGEGSSMI